MINCEKDIETWMRSLVKGITTLWNESQLCDVTLMSNDGARCKAHSIILCAASPVLKDMLLDGNTEIVLDTTSGVTCRTLLYYIYTGQIISETAVTDELISLACDLNMSQLSKVVMKDTASLELSQTNEEARQVDEQLHFENNKNKNGTYKSVQQISHKEKITHDLSSVDSPKDNNPLDIVKNERGKMLTNISPKEHFDANPSEKNKMATSSETFKEQFKDDTLQTNQTTNSVKGDIFQDTFPDPGDGSHNPQNVKEVIELSDNEGSGCISLHAEKDNTAVSSEVLKYAKSQCGYCEMVMGFNTVKRHIYEQHYDDLGDLTLGNNATHKEALVLKIKCLTCHEEVPKKFYPVHMITYHTDLIGADDKERYKNIRIGCLYCKREVRNNNYKDHVAITHPDVDALLTKSKAKSKQENILKKNLIDVEPLMMVNCVYCKGSPKYNCKAYKEHVLTNHSSCEVDKNKAINNSKESEHQNDSGHFKSKQENRQHQQRNVAEKKTFIPSGNAKYLYVDRNSCLPPTPPIPRNYMCIQCEINFLEKRDYLEHSMKHHGFPKQAQVCRYCSVVCHNLLARNDHEDDIHAVEKYQCETCGKLYQRASSLRTHKEYMHLGIRRKSLKPVVRKTAVCTYCGKVMPGSRMKSHIEIHHTKEKRYKCDNCEKAFQTSCGLRNHQKIHVGKESYPFKCSYCSQRCVRQHEIVYHERVHTGEKPYECNICRKRFRIALTLRSHMNNRHNVQLSGIKEHQKYYKPQGKTSFLNKCKNLDKKENGNISDFGEEQSKE